MPKRTDLVWLAHGTKERPGVVMKVVDTGRLYILAGTKVGRDMDHVKVTPGSQAGKILGLDFDTFFFAQPAFVDPSAIVRVAGDCPIGTFLKLEELIGMIAPPAPPVSIPVPSSVDVPPAAAERLESPAALVAAPREQSAPIGEPPED